MTGWNHLPLELRWIIVDYIREIISPPWPTTNPPYPQLPLVCHEWHGYFSHETFRIIVLDQDRLDDFQQFVGNNKPRQSHVERIILRVKLAEYDCTMCQMPEDEITTRANDTTFIDTLYRFMTLMTTWEKGNNRRFNRGIELDIGAYSPSDGRHDFRDCRFSEGYPYGASQAVYERHASLLGEPSTCPGWERACNGKKPLLGPRRRLLTTIGDLQSPHSESLWSLRQFACAPIFEDLVIRRHYYRPISSEILSRLIREGLPNLRCFRNETWAWTCPDKKAQPRFRQEYFAVLNALPDSIRNIHLFCESNAVLPLQGAAWNSQIGLELGAALAAVATRLTSCSASFFIEAGSFLMRSLSGNLHYPRLERLILTSRLLSRENLRTSPVPAINLLWSAVITAHRHMPELQFLDLWYGEKGDTFLVRFLRNQPGRLQISWYSTWHDENNDDDGIGFLFECLLFRRVVQPQLPGGLSIQRQPFPEKSWDTWHSTSHYSRLSNQFLHAQSWKQIEQENTLHSPQ